MKVRAAPLPPDLQHVLDGGVEYGHISGGAHAAISLFGDIATLDAIHAIKHDGCRGWECTAAMCADVEHYGQGLIYQIEEPDLRAACMGSTTTSFLYALADYGEFIAGQSFEDAIWGGSMIHRHETWANRRGRIYPRLARKIRTDGWVKRAIRYHHHESGYKHICHMRDLIGTPLPPASDEGFALLALTLNGQRARSAERSRQWIIAHRNDPVYQPDEVKVRLKPTARRALAKRRRSTIRAAALASAIVGAGAVSAFARGEPVRLEADQLVLEVRLGGELHRKGHSALNVMLKDTADQYLGGLCIYQDLPALDQLASLALHVQAGGIADVISTGNVFNPAPAAFAHPLLASKAPPPPAVIDGGGFEVVGTRVYPIDDHSARMDMLRAYCKDEGDRFRHRLFIDVLGAREGAAAWQTFVSFRDRERPAE